LQQTSRTLLSKLSIRRQIWVFHPHFEKVRHGVEPWLMARWKARVNFLLTVIELLFYLLTLMRYKAKRVKTHYFLEGEPRFQGEGGRPSGIFFGS